jgi:hypothetical protein
MVVGLRLFGQLSTVMLMLQGKIFFVPQIIMLVFELHMHFFAT